MTHTLNDHKPVEHSPELESARKQAQAALAETEALRKAIVTLARDPRMDLILDSLLGCIHDVVPYDSASVLFTEHEESPQLFVARESPHGAKLWPLTTLEINANPFVQRIVVARKSVLLTDTNGETDWRPAKALTNARCWIGVPLVMHDYVIGMLSISSRTPGFFTAEHFRLAKLLAIPLTVSIHRAQLYEWTAIYAAERKQLLQKVGPAPGSLFAGDPPLPT
jgi:GAF domain-containing protein